jgi:hypothetical protein
MYDIHTINRTKQVYINNIIYSISDCDKNGFIEVSWLFDFDYIISKLPFKVTWVVDCENNISKYYIKDHFEKNKCLGTFDYDDISNIIAYVEKSPNNMIPTAKIKYEYISSL